MPHNGLRFAFIMLFSFVATLGFHGLITDPEELANTFIALLWGDATFQWYRNNYMN